jgi:hypothetical protein
VIIKDGYLIFGHQKMTIWAPKNDDLGTNNILEKENYTSRDRNCFIDILEKENHTSRDWF